jgi:RiboL-PSP-HEPN
MFPPLKTEIESRFEIVEQFFRATRGFRGDLDAAARGMAFVQIYAIYEYAVKSIVQTAIDAINAHKTKMKDVSPALLTLFLDPELSGVRDCGERNVWTKRLEIFSRAFSKDITNLPNSAGPPHDGSHFRHTQLIMIFNVFGISRLPVRRKRHLFRIDEVVNNRNQIAHGGETAEDIGRRYTRPDILHIMEQMKSVCFLLVSIFDSYCADASRHRRK